MAFQSHNYNLSNALIASFIIRYLVSLDTQCETKQLEFLVLPGMGKKKVKKVLKDKLAVIWLLTFFILRIEKSQNIPQKPKLFACK